MPPVPGPISDATVWTLDLSKRHSPIFGRAGPQEVELSNSTTLIKGWDCEPRTLKAHGTTESIRFGSCAARAGWMPTCAGTCALPWRRASAKATGVNCEGAVWHKE